MSIQVRYFQAGRQLKSQFAPTMFEARRLANSAIALKADTAVILALQDDGREVELETRRFQS